MNLTNFAEAQSQSAPHQMRSAPRETRIGARAAGAAGALGLSAKTRSLSLDNLWSVAVPWLWGLHGCDRAMWKFRFGTANMSKQPLDTVLCLTTSYQTEQRKPLQVHQMQLDDRRLRSSVHQQPTTHYHQD